ncbi:MAG: OmpH family outer membrane protein [Bacteroidales bacterium]|nr:OmpH family outer membrane protein [Candidatus Cryptobacteroides aphodequi]
MKKSFILSIISLAGVIALAVLYICGNKAESNATASQQEVVKADIVFFQLDKVIAEYNYAKDLSDAFDKKATKVDGEVTKRRTSLEEDINRRGTTLEADVKAWQEKIDKGLMTRTTAEAQGQKLQSRQEELQQYAAQKQNEFQQYAAQKQNELAEEQQVTLNNIANAIKEYVDVFRVENGYSLILSTQGDLLPAPVATADSTFDVTDAIIAGLNAKYAEQAK